MRSIAVLTMIMTLSCIAVGQSLTCHNAVYFELFGNGVLYSVNYDRLFSDSFGMRVGVSYFSPFRYFITFPLMANYFVSWGSSKLELGLGACVVLQPENQSFSFSSKQDLEFRGNGVMATATVGYRYQPEDGGFVFRVGVTPFYGRYERDVSPTPYEEIWEAVDSFSLSGGLSLGYAF